MNNQKNLYTVVLLVVLGLSLTSHKSHAEAESESCPKFSKIMFDGNIQSGMFSQSLSLDGSCGLSVIIRKSGSDMHRSYFFSTDGEFGIIDFKRYNPKGPHSAWRNDATRSFFLFPRRYDQILIEEDSSTDRISLRLVTGDWISIDKKTGEIFSDTLIINQGPINWDAVGVVVKPSNKTIVMSTIQYWGGEQLKSDKAWVKNQYSVFNTIDGKKCRIKNEKLVDKRIYEVEFEPTKYMLKKWTQKSELSIFALQDDQQAIESLRNAALSNKNKECLSIAENLSHLSKTDERINTATIESSASGTAGMR